MTSGRAVPRTFVALGALAIAAACSVGQGSGSVTGLVHVADCGVDLPAYSMGPTFFAADFIEDPSAMDPTAIQRMVVLRIQQGSFRESDSDGLEITIRDVGEVQTSLLGTPIALGSDLDSMARMTVYFGRACDSGFPREYWRVPAVLAATSGTITFDSVHSPGVPDADGEDVGEFAGSFTDVRFEDPLLPDERFAVLSGSFSFFYQRGRPAQRFP